MRKIIVLLLIITAMTAIMTACVTKPNSADSIGESVTEYDYSSFIGKWQYIQPDSAQGIDLTIDSVKNNNDMSITLYDDISYENLKIVDNQVKFNDINMSLLHNTSSYYVELTFYDDYILATVYSKERYINDDIKKENELENHVEKYKLISDTAKPHKITNNVP
ncbi:hypothetical protein [Pseudobacteroides cellulosolvens]|uniref:Lipocalin-like domain-containing protein n=1 Tax=Pseudobacteroides cellulosolvens ATCC 35603 = DSM 2933 TaxID=398512 RepID=A0A0L6JP24_9FIRM|nr:hypothetical protein [Pseudobacteroides cellulosolvens]KNY27591.1 hypothetical protein Bccel_2862 [Pseudobacteroides cellulosolvens ATCC 35603 = DSM 2933]